MPINTLEYTTIFQEELDRQMVVESTSGWMEPNASAVKYNGGKEVKVPIMNMDGLGKYDKDNGFVQGAVSLEYKTMEMTQDRGRTFQLDAMDVNETNFVASAASVMGEFQRTKVVPEVDAYRYSKIARIAIDNGRVTAGYTAKATDILKTLRGDLYSIWDEIGEGHELVVSISTLIAKTLEESAEIQKILGVTEFAKGDIKLKVRTLDDVPLLRVPSARMFTAFDFFDGETAGQEKGGFKHKDDASEINWLITARRAPIAVSKTDTVRIFDPMTTQKANAWKLDYRKFHDLWILPNRVKGVWVNTKKAVTAATETE